MRRNLTLTFGDISMKLKNSKEAQDVSQENMALLKGLRALLDDPNTPEKEKKEIRCTFKSLLKKTDQMCNGQARKNVEDR
jgi:hypothetical protein